MGAVTRIGIGALAVAAAAVAGVLVLARGTSAPATAPTVAVAVRASFDPPVVQFGDPVTARIVVLLDRKAVHPQTLHVVSGLAPLTELSAPVTTRTASGRLETVTVIQRLSCLTDPCIARVLEFPPVRVSVSGREVTARWKPLQVKSRVSSSDLSAASPPFSGDTAPGSPTYRVSPSTAETLLDVVAALAAVAAVALLALHLLVARRRARPAVSGDEFARALRLVRESEQREAPDRRRALGLLSRLLDGGLKRTASDLAWSQPRPEPPAIDELVTRVEGEGGA